MTNKNQKEKSVWGSWGDGSVWNTCCLSWRPWPEFRSQHPRAMGDSLCRNLRTVGNAKKSLGLQVRCKLLSQRIRWSLWRRVLNVHPASAHTQEDAHACTPVCTYAKRRKNGVHVEKCLVIDLWLTYSLQNYWMIHFWNSSMFLLPL